MTRADAPPLHAWAATGEATPLPGGACRVGDLVFRTTARDHDAIAWLADIHELASRAGFAVPQHVPSVNDRLVERGWTCEQAIHGRPFTPEEVPQIAGRIAILHDLTRRVPQRPGFLSSQGLLQWARSGDIDLDTMPPDLSAACRAAWAPLSDQPLSIVHGDLTAANLLWCEDGRPGLLGWDQCRRDVMLFDTDEASNARLAWQVAARWPHHPHEARRLAEGLTA